MSDPQSPLLLSAQDLVPAESSDEMLDDGDLIADGGTEVMTRDASLVASIAKAAVEISAPANEAPIPLAPTTAPMLERDSDDREVEQERRVETTQRFDRSAIFVAPAPARPTSIPPMAMDIHPSPDTTLKLAAVRSVPSVTRSPGLAAAIAGGLVLSAVLLGTVAVRSSTHKTSTNGASPVVTAPREAQPIPACSGDIQAPETAPTTTKVSALPTQDANDIPVVSANALPSAPYPPRAPSAVPKLLSRPRR